MNSDSDVERLRIAIIEGLRKTEGSETEMDCLKEIKQLDLPVSKLHVFKYSILRWFLMHDCRFQENITEVEDINNWRLNNDFVFQFCNRDFDITICNHSASKNYRVILGVYKYTEGQTVVSAKYECVPEFFTRRPLTEFDTAFIFELNSKLTRAFHDKVLRKVLYGISIENPESEDTELRLPSSVMNP